VRQAVERQLADIRASVEQLAAGQDQMVREIAKIPVPPPPRLAPASKPPPIGPSRAPTITLRPHL
jgi:hypothetical protein